MDAERWWLVAWPRWFNRYRVSSYSIQRPGISSQFCRKKCHWFIQSVHCNPLFKMMKTPSQQQSSSMWQWQMKRFHELSQTETASFLSNEVKRPPSACLSDLRLNATLSKQSGTTVIIVVPDKSHRICYLYLYALQRHTCLNLKKENAL